MRRSTLAVVVAVLAVGLATGCSGGAEEGGGAASAGSGASSAGGGASAVDTASAVTLSVDTMEGAGAYLTDGQGRPLYLFTSDTTGRSTCHGACAKMWPPVTAAEGAATASAPTVRSDSIGYVTREGGATQVTYAGWPLYYFVKDAGAAAPAGQDMEGFGAVWYLVTPAGRELHAGEEAGEAEAGT